MWSNWVGQNRETNEEHDEDCIEKGFQLTRINYNRDNEGDREALGVEECSVNI